MILPEFVMMIQTMIAFVRIINPSGAAVYCNNIFLYKYIIVNVVNNKIHNSREFDFSDNSVITNINNRNMMHFYRPYPRSVDGVLRFIVPIYIVTLLQG